MTIWAIWTVVNFAIFFPNAAAITGVVVAIIAVIAALAWFAKHTGFASFMLMQCLFAMFDA
jgi:hypothetical protein